MIRRPPRSTRTDTLFPTRRASDLDRIGAGNREFRRGDRRVEPATDHPGDGHRDDRTAHHEGERRVPGTAGQIEEGADARGIGHAGYGKARAEQRAGEQGDDPAHHHDTPRARIAGPGTNPASMNAPVAAHDRGDRREGPPTPRPPAPPPPRP